MEPCHRFPSPRARVDMDGLPQRTRRIYLGILVVIFIIFTPFLMFYAAGYRLTPDLSIIQTGGIFVEVPRAGADFFLDDVFQGSSGLFDRNYFGQELLPGTYQVRIQQEGYHDWRKQMRVFPKRISNGVALMLPEEPELVAIPRFDTGTATSTFAVENEAYTDAVAFFAATSTGVSARGIQSTTTIQYRGATTTVMARGSIGLWKDDDGLHAWWLGERNAFPYFFCSNQICSRELTIAGAGSGAGHFDFFPADNQFIVVEWPDGVFVTELDTRPPQNIQPVHAVPGTQFRIINGAIHIYTPDDELFRVEL